MQADDGDSSPTPPLFSAITSSTRQLLSLLKCCSFQSKAQIQISHDGLRVTVEESHVMQGHAFVDRNLFTTYTFKPLSRPTPESGIGNTPAGVDDGTNDADFTISFGIGLSALLECLQIFGAEATREKWPGGGNVGGGGGGVGGGVNGTIAGTWSRAGPGAVFDQQVLRISGTCRISYRGQGTPLCLVLEENGVITTCELVTYEPEAIDDIPLARDALALKIIMKAGWLYDAIQELQGSSVDRLTIAASPQQPYFALSASGSMSSTVVEFSNDKSLLESFQVPEPIQHTYKFGLIKHAMKAMAIASKVSIRGDGLGVLSLQFMIEQEGGGPSFIDFRFLPFAIDEDE